MGNQTFVADMLSDTLIHKSQIYKSSQNEMEIKFYKIPQSKIAKMNCSTL